MSFYTWHTYGYGAEVTDITPPVDRLKMLIRMAPKFEKKINEWFVENKITDPTIEDYFEYDDFYNLGLAAIIKEVIEEAEGIEFTACDDYDDRTYLLYAQSYPWMLTPEEHTFNEEKIQCILAKYFSVITDETITLDYYEPENGG